MLRSAPTGIRPWTRGTPTEAVRGLAWSPAPHTKVWALTTPPDFKCTRVAAFSQTHAHTALLEGSPGIGAETGLEGPQEFGAQFVQHDLRLLHGQTRIVVLQLVADELGQRSRYLHARGTAAHHAHRECAVVD